MTTAVREAIVDCHVHLVPPALTRASGDDPHRPVVRRAGGRQLTVSLGGRPVTSIVSELCRPALVLAEAGALGIDHLVCSPWVATLPLRAGDGEAAAICRTLNRAMAELVGADRRRLSGLGAVPLQSPRLAVAELHRAMDDGLAGVELTASTKGVFLGDDRLGDFWKAAEETRALVFIHPTTRGLELPVMAEAYLWNVLGNPVETAIAAAQLVLAGVMERHRGLRIVLAHGGGVLPAVAGRLARAHAVRPEARERLTEPPDRSLRRLHYDTVTHDPEQLRRLVAWAGAERVLLGSDRPFDMADDDPVASVQRLQLPPADEALVLGGNALRLLGLGPPSGRRAVPGAEARAVAARHPADARLPGELRGLLPASADDA